MKKKVIGLMVDWNPGCAGRHLRRCAAPRQHSQWKPPRVVTKAASGSFGMGIARNKKVI